MCAVNQCNVANSLDQLCVGRPEQLLKRRASRAAIAYADFDFDQFVVLESGAGFLHHRTGDARLADGQTGLKPVTEPSEMSDLSTGECHESKRPIGGGGHGTR